MIVLLGRFYCPEESDCPTGLGFLDFCRDYYTRLWITYRTGMPPLLGSQVTSDCGWGCMIRTTQMAIAQAIIVNRMGRGWRYFGRKQSTRRKELASQPGSDQSYGDQVAILKLFEDCPSAALGIHRLLQISNASESTESSIGRWFAPCEVISLVKKALKLSASPLTSDLALLIAVDGLVVVGEAERECRHWSKRLLTFIPLRLGASSVNPNQVVDVDLGPGEGSKRTKDPLFTVQYQETSMSDSLRETTNDENAEALESMLNCY
ncbi:peptidase family C54 [Ostertagia ostertagi]